MEVLNTALITLLLLLVGDFLSTFFYHVPEHVFGKFHTLVHHGKNRSFLHYALLTKNPWALINGWLGTLPYFILVPWFWSSSPLGTLLGLLLGELHVVWRHVSPLKWKTPALLERICNLLCITTPERHWRHHQDATIAYGDIFTFYDQPAQAWLKVLLLLKRKLSQPKHLT